MARRSPTRRTAAAAVNLWVRDVRSGADRQLTHGTAAAMQAAWSPDGSRIAFSDPDGQIQVVDVKSGATRKAHERLNEAGRASWSPDGNALVVSALKAYSTRFREGTNQVLRVSLGRPAGSLVRSHAAQVGRHAGRLWPRVVSRWHPDGGDHRRAADRVAGGARRRAAGIAPFRDHRARRIADVDRRFAPDPVSERPSPEAR